MVSTLFFILDDKFLVDEFHGKEFSITLLSNQVDSGESTNSNALDKLEVLDRNLFCEALFGVWCFTDVRYDIQCLIFKDG
jgi:hypothetical protein